MPSYSKSSLSLPFEVRTIGHQVTEGWEPSSVRETEWVGLIWTLSGKVLHLLDRKKVVSVPGTLLIHAAGSRVQYKPLEIPWDHRWITIRGPAASSLPGLLKLPVGKALHGIRPRLDILNEIACLRKNFSIENEYEASLLAYRLLLDISKSLNVPGIGERPGGSEISSLIKRSLVVIDNNFSDASFDVARLASELKIHRGHLYRVFMKNMGISPSGYIQQKRLRKAMGLLQDETLSIKEIAFRTGFSGPVYFTKFIKARTGSAPGALRYMD